MAKNQLKLNKLTPAEEHVIVGKGTERPGTGKFNAHFQAGVYTCKRCETPLYNSSSKFDSGCGWPSFDDEITGAVERVPDADGRRTEIICSACKGHLGHVFTGEQFTEKNTRHCVNLISLSFTATPDEKITETAYFAGGCFWGLEFYFQKASGVISTRSGYMGGNKDNPTYEEVCSKTTGHIETVEVIFDPDVTSFEILARLFFEIHDPGQLDRQGPDIGPQYKSAIFFTGENQEQIAAQLIDILQKKDIAVVTELNSAKKFWPAEDYHQDYYKKTATTPYCHFYTKRF